MIIQVILSVIIVLLLIALFTSVSEVKRLKCKNSRLTKEIADILSGATLPQDVQAKINELFTRMSSNKSKIEKLLDK